MEGKIVKEQYEQAEIEIVSFEVEDVITTSDITLPEQPIL